MALWRESLSNGVLIADDGIVKFSMGFIVIELV